MPLTTEALTFDVLDDLLLAHERGRVPPVRRVPGPCLGSIIELFHFSQENNGALPYRASDDTAAIQRAYETRRPVYLNGESTAFVTARRAQYKGGDTDWTAFQVAMHKALLAAGFPSLLARGLVGAMGEMQNNIRDHSDAIDTGLIAYRVTADRVEWVVADRGVGVLNSLKSGAFPSGAKTRPMRLRGRAVIKLEEPAESLTTSDRAGSDDGHRGGDEFVVQPLVRTFFVIMNHERAHGRAKMRFAQQHHPLQAFRLGRLDKAFCKCVQIGTPRRQNHWPHTTVTQ